VEHVVFFPAHDGSPAFRRVANLEDAVRLVEHLRNVEGVNEVSCHVLTEAPADEPAVVPTQVAEDVEPPALADAVAAPQVEAEPSSEPAAEPVMASANGHATEGAKSLGFFA